MGVILTITETRGGHAVMSAVGWGVKRPARAERGAHLELLQQSRQEWDFPVNQAEGTRMTPEFV